MVFPSSLKICFSSSYDSCKTTFASSAVSPRNQEMTLALARETTIRSFFDNYINHFHSAKLALPQHHKKGEATAPPLSLFRFVFPSFIFLITILYNLKFMLHGFFYGREEHIIRIIIAIIIYTSFPNRSFHILIQPSK